jgi:hypothetical protein
MLRVPAGQQRVVEDIACVCSTVLGGLLERKRVSELMPVGELIGGMRCLYTMLPWSLRRIAELVRARAEHAPAGSSAERGWRMRLRWQPALRCRPAGASCMGRSLRAAQQPCASKPAIITGRRTSVPAAMRVQGGH